MIYRNWYVEGTTRRCKTSTSFGHICGLTPRHNFIELKSKTILQLALFVLICSDKGLKLETSALKLFAVANYIINSVDKMKSSCHSHLISRVINSEFCAVFQKIAKLKTHTFKILAEFHNEKCNTLMENSNHRIKILTCDYT